MPKLLFRKKYWLYVIGLVMSSYLVIGWRSSVWSGYDFDYFFVPKSEHIVNLFYGVLRILFASLSFRLFEEWSGSEYQKLSLQKEMKISELRYLKLQMSPHFLFNTLNNIYSLSIKGSQKTTKALAQLKSSMDYLLHFEEGKKTTLKTEIQYLKNYVALNQLRYPVQVKFEIDVENESIQIEPMLLLPFIENAFKHGETSAKGKVSIYVFEKKQVLLFYISNDLNKLKRKDNTSGVGTENVKRRLDLIYSGKSSLDINETKSAFDVRLKLKLI
jgi:LytS/YehU family sensor histidine kinase